MRDYIEYIFYFILVLLFLFLIFMVVSEREKTVRELREENLLLSEQLNKKSVGIVEFQSDAVVMGVVFKNCIIEGIDSSEQYLEFTVVDDEGKTSKVESKVYLGERYKKYRSAYYSSILQECEVK